MEKMREVFDQIAPGWYGFRHWTIFRRELEEMAERWRGGRLLNVGCGHGPDFLPLREKFELYGVDFSSQMLNFARKYAEKFGLAINLVLADAVYLPFSDNAFDWAISVATYHHIKGSRERLTAWRELRRVLKPGGEAFITVWNRYQPAFWFKGKETLVPWHTKETTLYRYYYLFSYGELEKLAQQAGFKLLKAFPESTYHFPMRLFSRNICLLVRKD
jgi:ubiquinone/menaquinone biosynthesis C-methylase UbiE